MRYNRRVKSRRGQIDYAALAEFRYEIRRFLNFSERMAHAAGLEPQQYQALLALKGLPTTAGSTVGALAKRMLLRHHSAVELADRLEARGMLRRVPSPADGRQVLLRLTARGNRALKKVAQPNRVRLQTAGPLLINALRSVLRQASRAANKKRRMQQTTKRREDYQ